MYKFVGDHSALLHTTPTKERHKSPAFLPISLRLLKRQVGRPDGTINIYLIAFASVPEAGDSEEN